jgi:hypothetical protein
MQSESHAHVACSAAFIRFHALLLLHATSAESWIEGMEFSSIQTWILPSSGLVGAMGRMSINQTPRVHVNHGFAAKDRSGYINDPSAGPPTDPNARFPPSSSPPIWQHARQEVTGVGA